MKGKKSLAFFLLSHKQSYSIKHHVVFLLREKKWVLWGGIFFFFFFAGSLKVNQNRERKRKMGVG